MDINELIHAAIRKKIIIWGTGINAIKVINALGILFENVVCFIDSFPKETSFFNREVFYPSEYKQYKQNADLLIIASVHTQEILGTIKQNNDLKSMETFFPFAKDKYNYPIGKLTYGLYSRSDFHENIESIGNYCSINGTALIGASPHPMNFVSTHPFLYFKNRGFIERDLGPTVEELSIKASIGNDVWIGANAIILSGVKVHDGAVIGAGAIVTKDVPPYGIVIGVPAKLLRYRFSPNIIESLLRIKWWFWSEEKIKDNLTSFYNIEEFVKKHDPLFNPNYESAAPEK
jgi:acetyltransferase-like isoleucine patch superfamily enzyme